MRAFLCGLLLVAVTCASPQSRRPDTNSEPLPEVIVRSTSWEDAELAAKGLGRLEIVVRVADRPAQVVQQANVALRVAGDEGRWRYILANERGVAVVDSLAVGRYELLFRAIGYAPAKTLVTVLPGCRSDVEAYIGLSAIGIDPPLPEPSRIRVTTCRP